jgi:hypothetical protein
MPRWAKRMSKTMGKQGKRTASAASGGKGGRRGGGGGKEEIVDEEDTDDIAEEEEEPVDETGVLRPTDSVQPEVIDLDNSGLTPGQHGIKTALYVGEDWQGPTSVEDTWVNLPAGHGLRIHRPMFHNNMDNPMLTERQLNAPNTPRDFTFFAQAQWDTSNYISALQGSLTIRRLVPGTNVTSAIFSSSAMYLREDEDQFVVRFKIGNPFYGGGHVGIYLDEYTANGTFIVSTLMEQFGKLGDATITREWKLTRAAGEEAQVWKLKINNSTAIVRMRVVGEGSTRTGSQNFEYIITDLGAFDGYASPKKVDEIDKLRGAAVEPTNKNYPHGGYCIIRREPPDTPVVPDYEVIAYTTFETDPTVSGDPLTTGFEHGHDYPSQQDSGRVPWAALEGSHGWYIEKFANTAGPAKNDFWKSLSTTRSRLAIKWDMNIKYWYGSGRIILGYIYADSSILALIQLEQDGKINLYAHTNNFTWIQNEIPLYQIGANWTMGFELECINTDTNNGTAILRYKIGGDLQQAVSITGIPWSGRGKARGAGIGSIGAGANTGFKFLYDNVYITDETITSYQPSPGNYIEYYGPKNTPKSPYYGPTDMVVPVKGGLDYTISTHINHEYMDNDSELFHLRTVDENGTVLETYGPVVGGFSWYSWAWNRISKTITAHPSAKYLEFYQNKLGGGKLLVYGTQVEQGTEMTPFDATMQPAGWLSVYLQTRPEGMPDHDPMIELARVQKINGVDVYATDTKNTSHLVRYRSGDNFIELDNTPWSYNWESLNYNKKIIEVRVDLTSTSSEETPEIRGIALDVTRAHSQLCRADGTEYKGGTIVNDITPIHTPPNVENIAMASGGISSLHFGNERISRISFKLTAFRNSAAEEITYYQNHVLEMPHKKLTVVFEAAPEWAPVPSSRVYLGDGREFFQKYETEVTAFVTSNTEDAEDF